MACIGSVCETDPSAEFPLKKNRHDRAFAAAAASKLFAGPNSFGF